MYKPMAVPRKTVAKKEVKKIDFEAHFETLKVSRLWQSNQAAWDSLFNHTQVPFRVLSAL